MQNVSPKVRLDLSGKVPCKYMLRPRRDLLQVHMVYGKHLSARNPYWYRAITSEPCYFEAKDLMQAISKEGLERFKSNPFWMQYSQCHHGAPDLLTAPSWR